MRVATWNINSIGARMEALLSFLSRAQPDVLCLQETKCSDESFPLQMLQTTGYHTLFAGQKAYNGVAVLSRQPARLVNRGFDDRVQDPAARFLAVRLGDLTVCSAYVPNGKVVGSETYFYKLNWLARLRRWLDRDYRPDDALIVAGDFNVAPADEDVHDPKAWRESLLCSGRERDALKSLQEFGLTDVFRHLCPKESGFTWWDYRAGAFARNHGLRIDLLLATSSVLTRSNACTVSRDLRAGERPSDHAPVVLDLSD